MAPLSNAKRRLVGETEAENSHLFAENATPRMERDVLKKPRRSSGWEQLLCHINDRGSALWECSVL